jgi:Ca2+-binding EF-hand superfamily protein
MRGKSSRSRSSALRELFNRLDNENNGFVTASVFFHAIKQGHIQTELDAVTSRHGFQNQVAPGKLRQSFENGLSEMQKNLDDQLAFHNFYEAMERCMKGMAEKHEPRFFSKRSGYLLLITGVLTITPDSLLIRNVSVADVDMFTLLFLRCSLYATAVLLLMCILPGQRSQITLTDKWCTAAGLLWGCELMCFTSSIRHTAGVCFN